MKKTKKNKDIELSCKALGAAMFMLTVVLYMVIGTLYARISGEDFNYHVSFAFLIQGMIVSMLSSLIWIVCFGFIKSWRFFTRYLLLFIVIVAFFVVSILIPIINSAEGYGIWIISGVISTFVFTTAVAVLSEKQRKKTGARSVLLWELE